MANRSGRSQIKPNKINQTDNILNSLKTQYEPKTPIATATTIPIIFFIGILTDVFSDTFIFFFFLKF